MSINLGKSLLLKSNLNNDLSPCRFNINQSLKEEIGILNSAFYIDNQKHILFIYLKVRDFNKYRKLSLKDSGTWWSNLTPINAVNRRKKTILEYVWQDIFQIKDQKET